MPTSESELVVIKEISTQLSEFRKAGYLNEALELYSTLSVDEKQDFYVQQARIWIQYSLFKKALELRDKKEVKVLWSDSCLHDLLESDNSIMIQSFMIIASRTLFLYDKNELGMFSFLFKFIEYHYKSIPKENWKFWILAAKKHINELPIAFSLLRYIVFEQTPIHAFEKENYLEKNIPSAFESGLNLYLKSYIASINSFQIEPFPDSITTEKLIIYLLKILNTQLYKPTFIHYYLAKLYLLVGKKNEAAEHSVKQLVVKHESWVYSLLAACVEEHEFDLKEALLIKAYRKSSNDEIRVKISQELAKVYVEKQDFARASYLIHEVLQTYKRNVWREPQSMLRFTGLDWFNPQSSTEPVLSEVLEQLMNAFLIQFLTKTEAVVYSVYNGKSFAITKTGTEILIYNREWPIGTGLDCALSTNTNKVLFSVESKKVSEALVKCVSGKLQITALNYGFIEGCFVPAHIIEQAAAKPNHVYEANVMLTKNKKKGTLGFSAFNLNAVEPICVH